MKVETVQKGENLIHKTSLILDIRVFVPEGDIFLNQYKALKRGEFTHNLTPSMLFRAFPACVSLVGGCCAVILMRIILFFLHPRHSFGWPKVFLLSFIFHMNRRGLSIKTFLRKETRMSYINTQLNSHNFLWKDTKENIIYAHNKRSFFTNK